MPQMKTVRIPFPPAVLITLILVSILLLLAYLIAPETIRIALLACGALAMALVAFTSVELTIHMLILSTLLGPEVIVGSEAVAGAGSSRGFTLRLDDILLTIIGLTWLFRMALTKELGVIRRTPINQPIGWYLMISLVATMIGMFSGRVSAFGFFFVLKYLEYFVIFYMIVNQVHDEESIKRYIWVMLFTCFAVSLFGIAQIPGGERVSAPFEGETGEPNTFGGYLVLMFSVATGIFMYNKERRLRLILGVICVCALVALAFTESRSSYLAFVGAIGMFMIFLEQKRLFIAIMIVGLILSPVVMPGNVIDRVMYTFTQAKEGGQIQVGDVRIDTSTSERLNSWKDAFETDFIKHPLLGVGVTGGRFLDAQYPRVLTESGILGFVAFIWFLRRVWVLLRQSCNELSDPILKGVAVGTLCGYGGLLLHAIGANTFIIVRVMEPFMILMGLILGALLIEKQKSSEQQAKALEKSGADFRAPQPKR